MSENLILFHDEALRINHPVYAAAPQGTKAIFVWDDTYFRAANFSLKRLIFIYETLCELGIEIICGDIAVIINELAPRKLYVAKSNNQLISKQISMLKSVTQIEEIDDEAFAKITKPADYRRFFQYWNKAEKSAFQQNGGADA